MERAFPEADVTGYRPLISAMSNDPKDRQVVAAAVKAGAQVIVTSNIKDFSPLPDGLRRSCRTTFCATCSTSTRTLSSRCFVTRRQTSPSRR